MAPGRAVVEFEAGEQYTRLSDHPAPEGRNPFISQVVGGTFGAVADSAMDSACASLLGEGEGLTTLEMKLSFLRPVKPG
jgi:acyl-coenzyme A thioesterase PaaI-like protein